MNRMKRFNYTFILLPFLACWLLLASCGGMKVECEGFEPSVTTKLVEKDMKLYLKEIPGAEKVNYVLCGLHAGGWIVWLSGGREPDMPDRRR